MTRTQICLQCEYSACYLSLNLQKQTSSQRSHIPAVLYPVLKLESLQSLCTVNALCELCRLHYVTLTLVRYFSTYIMNFMKFINDTIRENCCTKVCVLVMGCLGGIFLYCLFVYFHMYIFDI